jgi:integrase
LFLINRCGMAIALEQKMGSASAQLSAIDAGLDPSAPVPVSEPASDMSFEAVWTRYYDEWVLPGKTPTGWQNENAQAFEKYFRPLWEGRDVASITRQAVRTLLKGIAAKGTPYMANRVHSMLNRFFNWCVDDAAILEANPMLGLKGEKEKKRDRVLSMEELRAMWLASERIGWPWGPVFKLLLLTGQRLSEITDMRWSELDLRKRVLSLPGQGRRTVVRMRCRSHAWRWLLSTLSTSYRG